MFPQLPPQHASVPVIRMILASMTGTMLMELFGSIGTFEFMALTGNAGQRNSHEKQEKEFHRRAS